MAEPPEKGFVPVSMQPNPGCTAQDPPPPYSGAVPFAENCVPYGLQSHPTVSLHNVPDSVQLLVPTAPPPRDYVAWSLFNTMFCNIYCLGFAALVFSIKSRDRLVMGDIASAHRYGLSARRLNIAVICVSLVTMIFIIIRVWSAQ